MKLLIDMTHINIDKLYASLSIYVFRILDAIDDSKRENITLLIPENLEPYIKDKYKEYKYIIFSYPKNHFFKIKFLRILIQIIQYKRLVNNSGCDILLIANELCPYTILKTKLKKVIVIHDLKAIQDKTLINSTFKRYINFNFYKLNMINSHSIIAISNYTKYDILKYYNKYIDEQKISVIYNSVDISDKGIQSIPYLNEIKYILYVNTLQEYKNIETLIKAYILIKNDISEKVVIVGKKTEYWNNKIMSYIKQYNLHNDIIILENVSDEELHYLYSKARLFVTTSLREGFGYTPIEAAICMCPVVSSTCEALPETTMNRLNYYSPAKDEYCLSKKIYEILMNPYSYTELKSISEQYLEKYSCKKQAETILQLLEDL